MTNTATKICCRRCGQHLAVERGGMLLVGVDSFECVVRLRCRICAHETTWLPSRARAALEVKAAEQPEVRVSKAVKGLWFKDAA